jgi:hypothetical protein
MENDDEVKEISDGEHISIDEDEGSEEGSFDKREDSDEYEL